jgi:DNA repair exonuclease SbcCD ATPase subunit
VVDLLVGKGRKKLETSHFVGICHPERTTGRKKVEKVTTKRKKMDKLLDKFENNLDKFENNLDQFKEDLKDLKQIMEGLREAMASEAAASEDVASEAASVASQIKDKKPRRVKKPCRVIFNYFPRFKTKQKKIHPPINQFHSDLDRQTATQLFHLLNNYRPKIETKQKKKKRLKKKGRGSRGWQGGHSYQETTNCPPWCQSLEF